MPQTETKNTDLPRFCAASTCDGIVAGDPWQQYCQTHECAHSSCRAPKGHAEVAARQYCAKRMIDFSTVLAQSLT
jgi:hypothetical protein